MPERPIISSAPADTNSGNALTEHDCTVFLELTKDEALLLCETVHLLLLWVRDEFSNTTHEKLSAFLSINKKVRQIKADLTAMEHKEGGLA